MLQGGFFRLVIGDYASPPSSVRGTSLLDGLLFPVKRLIPPRDALTPLSAKH